MSENIERTLGRLEAKVDALLAMQDGTERRLDNHAGRIASQERWRSFLAGAYALLLVVVGAFFKFHER